jgi:Clr5 domain
MAKDWEPLQDEIQKLYHTDNKPLSEVMRLIKGKHGFIASYDVSTHTA